ncbi:MAG: MBL fold metallo-hydrolase [Mycobacteriales bacterium]
MKVTVLGSAGTFPSAESACSAYLVEHDGFQLLLDMGNGSLGALQRYAGLLAPDAVFLSHLHADHCVDLLNYSYARRWHPEAPPPITVHGPLGTSERLQDIGGSSVGGFAGVYDFARTTEGSSAIGPFAITLAKAAHPVETYSIRLDAGGASLVYSGDSGPTEALVANARDADLLLCEATWEHGADHPRDLHMTAREAGEHAHRANVGTLLLVHTTPFTDDDTLREQAAAEYDGELEIPAQGATYTL